ncbi:uncharacterized protein PFB0765w [Nilaparvata lugens]|uniref:uncharacterized protein PFB0765w n=1 Tax=Nilaparvata lugens TaxID=108931 RepID=UPI00193D2B80|nr:uncharacterized protein PFB0765w [Nilaparvata lugens]
MEQKDKECDDLKKMYIELKAAKENAIKTIESNLNTRISKLMTDLDCSTSKMKEMEIHAQEIKNKYQTTLEENHQLSSNLEEVTDLFMQLVSKLKPDQISGDSNSNATKLKSIAELKEIASEIIFGDKDSNNDTLKKEYELKIREKEKEIGTLRSLLDSKEKNLADALALVKKTETESVSATVMNQCNTDSNNCSDLEVISAKYEEKLRLLQNEHALQTKRLEQDYSKKVSAIERSHSEIINTIKKEIEAKMKEVEEREKYILNDFQQRLIDQENNLKSKYLADLNAAEETAKTLTIQHFASQVKKIEEYYQKEYESSRTKMEQAAINSINTLKRVIAEKEKEIFDLKSMNQKSSNEKVNMLEKKSEEDRMKLIILTKQVTEMQEELSSKQKSINQLSVELNDAVREKRELNYRIDVLKNRSNEVIKSQFTKVLNRLQLQIDENLFKGANEYDRKIQEVEEMYSARENEMKKRDKS